MVPVRSASITGWRAPADQHGESCRRRNLLSRTGQASATLSLVTTYGSHDAHGNARAITDPNGEVTTLVYDARQRLTSVNRSGETTRYTLDPAGLLERVTQPDGSYLLYVYDDAQRLIRVEDVSGNRIEYTLDAMGKRTAETVRDSGGTLRQAHSR